MSGTSNYRNRTPNGKHSMLFLREARFDPNYILDIGVATGTPWINEVFPNAFYKLIEPDSNYNEQIHNNHKDFNYELTNIALGLENSESLNIKIVKSEISDSGEYIGNRQEIISVPVVTLDSLNIEPNGHSIIKIDVDGYDSDVLLGGKNTVTKFDILVVESKLKDINKITSIVPDCFTLWDIVNLSYGYGHLGEVDLVFKNTRLELEQPDGFIKNQPFRQGGEHI